MLVSGRVIFWLFDVNQLGTLRSSTLGLTGGSVVRRGKTDFGFRDWA